LKIVKENKVEDTTIKTNEDYWRARQHVQKAYDILFDVAVDYNFAQSIQDDELDKSSLMDIYKKYADCTKLLAKTLNTLKDIKGL
jgi:hypothetical protein